MRAAILYIRKSASRSVESKVLHVHVGDQQLLRGHFPERRRTQQQLLRTVPQSSNGAAGGDWRRRRSAAARLVQPRLLRRSATRERLQHGRDGHCQGDNVRVRYRQLQRSRSISVDSVVRPGARWLLSLGGPCTFLSHQHSLFVQPLLLTQL